MTGMRNRRWLLAAYPRGVPVAADFTLSESDAVAPLQTGQIRVRVIYLSMDPAPRMRMDPVPRMGPPLSLGSVVIGRGAGIIEESASPRFARGDLVTGELGWQESAVVSEEAIRKVDGALGPLSAHLGLLASSGLTAYLTLHDCANAQPGETVVVSAAAGSVGLAACQLARAAGCRVVALAHGPAQAQFVSQRLAVDAAIDDSRIGGLGTALEEACPKRVDVFLDSVGGAVHDAVMDRINVRGRAVLYGFISAYNSPAGGEPAYGRMYQVIRQRAHVMGFLLGDHAARMPAVLQEIAAALRVGRLQSFETIAEGIEQVPAAFTRLFGECSPGKQLVRLAPDPTQENPT